MAVFLYTQNTNMAVNDIDLSHAEEDYPKIVAALTKKGIRAEITE